MFRIILHVHSLTQTSSLTIETFIIYFNIITTRMHRSHWTPLTHSLTHSLTLTISLTYSSLTISHTHSLSHSLTNVISFLIPYSLFFASLPHYLTTSLHHCLTRPPHSHTTYPVDIVILLLELLLLLWVC